MAMEKNMTLALLFLMVTLAIGQNVVILNRGCKQFSVNGQCVACSQRFYRDGQGICQPVNVNCNGYNSATGACTTCYPGHVLIQDTCLPEALFPVSTFDPFCNKFEGDVCVKCAWGYYFDSSKRCKQADPNCASFNQKNGVCQSCYGGFTLSGNKCVPAQAQPFAQNCNQINNGACVKCSIGFYFNKDNICTKIPDDCQNFNVAAKKCQGCYSGYQLDKDNKCVKAVAGVTDLGCSKFENGICTKCSVGYYFNRVGKCSQIPPTCARYDTVTETCQQCFPGHALNAIGICVAAKTDAGCNTFENGRCVKCSDGFYFGADGKTCKQIPATCDNYDTVFEKCLQCYPGYTTNEKGICIESKAGDINAGCNKFENQICVKCSYGYYFGVKAGETSLCKQIPSSCANFDTSKQTCKECYPGYILDKSLACIKETTADIDGGCKSFKDGACVECSFGFYFDNGKCVVVPATCANFDIPNRKCKACYPGYSLNSRFACVEEAPAQIDAGCNEFKDGICVKCSFGFYFESNGKCAQIPSECANFNIAAKKCLACFEGYTLKNDKCVKAETESVTDFGCAEFSDGLCVKCSNGYYFGANGKCKIVPPTCASFDIPSEKCKACYPGYELNKNSACVASQIQKVEDSGCNTFVDGVCTKCSFGYYFNEAKKCVQIPVQCARFDTTRRACLECYPGYKLGQNQRCVESVSEVSDAGCSEFKDNVCVKCSVGYYFKNNKCILIPPTCAKYNTQKQMCESCYPGYELNNKNQCTEKAPVAGDTGCSEFKDNVCIKCSEGYYFNDLKKCQLVPVTCQNFDIPNRVCKGCYPGYSLNAQKQCVEADSKTIDPFCKSFKDGNCIECAKGTFFNAQKKCQVLDPLCRTFNPADGACTACYPGYQISGKTCKVSTKAVGDVNCKTFVNEVCVECSFRHYKNGEGKCVEVNPDCQEYDDKGACTSCYVGFKVEGRICVEDNTIAGDPNCAEWADGLCMKCSKGTFFDPAGLCKNADPLCKTFSEFDGACLTCYTGFKIQGKNCVEDKDRESSHCAEYLENEPSVCLRCSKGYFFNSKKECAKVSDLCATYNEKTGDCLSCFVGFELNKGKCVEKVVGVSDLNCAKFDGNGKCTECSGGYYFNPAGKCIIANPLCRLFDTKDGKCTECYIGYALKNGACIRDEKNADLCAEYIEKICVRCAQRAYYNSQGVCQLVDDDCKTFDLFNGQCTSCYPGFVQEGGKCRKAREGEQGCARYDDSGKCVECPERSYLQGQKCVQVDDTCKDFNYESKVCRGCYPGYALLGGKCEISEVQTGKQIQNCFAYTPEGMCLECFDRFYLKENSCKEVDIFCKGYEKSNGRCTACYTSFKLQNGKCVQ